ncbi:MAG: ABC transporter ATP-binding protein [Saprospiraceae bacterium]
MLDFDQKKRSLLMLGLLFLNAIFDVVGLAGIFPLIDAALAPETIQDKWYLKYPYDFFGVEDNVTFLFLMAAIVFIIFIIKNALSVVIFYTQSKFAFNISLRLNKKMFQYYYDQGFLFINDQEVGKRTYDIITVPYYFASSYLIETLIMCTELIVLLIIFISIIFYKPAVVLILLSIIIPVFMLVYVLTKKRTKSIGDERNVLAPKAHSVILDALSAYPDVKLANKEQVFFDQYEDVQKSINILDAQYQGIFSKVHQRLNDIVLGLGLLIIFGIAMIFKEKSTEILAILSVFGLASYRFLPSINRIMNSVLSLKNVSYVIQELRAVQNKPLITYIEVEPMTLNSSVAFHDIKYAYPLGHHTVLDGISFEIKKGETVGFIGTSGSGKTTLLNLFLRFIHESQGHISIDGVRVDQTNEASFQKTIGYVQQNVYIRNGSLRENIAFGERLDQLDSQKLQLAIDDAMLADFVAGHPDGINMQLGESGVKLSGGQRQRIGIARALYKDSQILVFDEATSALDSETERAIVATINHLAKLDKTIIIVAHRVTTLEMCDRIYELEGGQIKGVHQYQDILKKYITFQ